MIPYVWGDIMLNVYFGRDSVKDKKSVLDTRIYFRRHKRAEWFEDDFVKRFLKEIDGSEVLFDEALKNRFGKGISTEQISTGCKTLCCIYYNDDKDIVFYGTAMGDNCYKFVMEMARNKDISLFFEHYPEIESKYFEEGLVAMNDKILSEYDFEDAYCDWVGYMDRLAEEEDNG